MNHTQMTSPAAVFYFPHHSDLYFLYISVTRIPPPTHYCLITQSCCIAFPSILQYFSSIITFSLILLIIFLFHTTKSFPHLHIKFYHYHHYQTSQSCRVIASSVTQYISPIQYLLKTSLNLPTSLHFHITINEFYYYHH